MQSTQASSDASTWNQLAPLLDEAIARLTPPWHSCQGKFASPEKHLRKNRAGPSGLGESMAVMRNFIRAGRDPPVMASFWPWKTQPVPWVGKHLGGRLNCLHGCVNASTRALPAPVASVSQPGGV